MYLASSAQGQFEKRVDLPTDFLFVHIDFFFFSFGEKKKKNSGGFFSPQDLHISHHVEPMVRSRSLDADKVLMNGCTVCADVLMLC